MAEDVIDNMENMKLTFEEEEIIVISDEGRLAEIERQFESHSKIFNVQGF